MATIRPFRVVDEHDVINLFKWNPSGAYPQGKGLIVKILSGWNTDQELAELGSPGASYGNTVSQRYGVEPYVVGCTATGDVPIGMLLYDIRETDENGEKLLFNPTKAAQMQCVLSGQAVPIVTKGIFLYSGVNNGDTTTSPTANAPAYLGDAGTITTTGNLASVGLGVLTRVGTFLGGNDSHGWTLVKLNIQ